MKEGGELRGSFAVCGVSSRKTLPDVFPRGYLFGFAFAPDCRSVYYVIDIAETKRPLYKAAYQHVLGTPFNEDREIFCAGEEEKLRLCLMSDASRLGFFVYRFLDKTLADIYLQPFEGSVPPPLIFSRIDYMLCLH